MGKFDEHYKTIDLIEGFLRRDLIGPVEKEEVIMDEPPLNYYPMGVLWAKKTGADLMDDEDLEDPVSEVRESIDLSNQYKPSAMAVSAMVGPDTETIEVAFSFAKYKHFIEKGEQRILHRYERIPYCSVVEFHLTNRYQTLINDDCSTLKNLEIALECTIRKVMEGEKKLVTVSVSNQRTASQSNADQNEAALFQCHLAIKVKERFSPIYENTFSHNEKERQINTMLYKDVDNYAFGHGCATKYEEKRGVVNRIESEFMPVQQVLQMMPNTVRNDDFLQLSYWCDQNKVSACQQLEGFIKDYGNWCYEQNVLGRELTGHQFAVEASVERIELCIQRLQAGVEVLKDDGVWRSFCLMNEAMMLQRIKTKQCKAETVKWYPFQLAYILQILPDIVDQQSEFRDVVDLLWFPTGGGKTEAYLGVSAFVIFYRRLFKKPEMDGVAIIMRYTLRLLTIQQFERATALICACEYLRRTRGIPGGEINIGLWIGSSMTPNSRIEAAKIIDELRLDSTRQVFEGNPVQITVCPWCGVVVDIGCYRFKQTMTISCRNNPNCIFHEGLPIYVVDDDIYEVCPTLILSTVDKFARIVWEERSKAIFGEGDCPPPELIIQDELHLISGPLGSITGIYEIAIERLCERDGKKPKVIASTATVKNAAEQIANLYNKKMFQFPPNGISADDSYFAIRADQNERPARRYLGFSEPGGSLADLLIRIYANLFFTRNLLIKQGIAAEIIDQYYTVVGYFNAIKDLGASASMINDRVSTGIKALVLSKFKKESEACGLSIRDIKNYEKNEELTSRKTAKEIKDTLRQLSKPYKSDLCFSYILASNMLSVGIDIDRLGIMTVYNQPKSNAEYIQATSRVGRSNPGLILTMYNSMRSRDKSHYEQFTYYHKTFYQFVESTSVTPYSARAIEKALHCVYIALIRHLIPSMSKNRDVVNFRTSLSGVAEIKADILKRVGQINEKAEPYAREWLEETAAAWERLAVNNPDTLVYSDYRGGLCLLNAAEKQSNIEFPTILNALRNVDQLSNVYIMRREGV